MTTRRRACSASSTRNSRPARAPSAPPGSMAGGATGTATTTAPSRRSRVRPARFPARTTGRPICIGRRAPTPGSGMRETAGARFRLVYQDYGNSYYGRLAQRRVERRPGQPEADRAIAASLQPVTSTAPRPPTADRIRLLLANGLYDAAIAELRYAQRQWGTSPAIEATIAWAYHREGGSAAGDHAHAPRLPAVDDGERPPVAGRDAPGDFPAGLLGPDPEALERLRPRPLRDGGADRAGVDLRPRHPVGRQCVGPDAGGAGDRQATGAEPWHAPLQHQHADQP